MAALTEIPNRDRWISMMIVAGAVVMAVAFSWFFVGQRYWCDDSFISFRYARNLYEGHGLVFNPGQRVEGYTNFLWTLVAYLGLRLGFQPIGFSQIVSIIAQAATLLLVYDMGARYSGPGLRALLAPLFLASQIAVLTYPMTGMETTFFTMLVTLAVWLCLTDAPRTRAGGLMTGFVLLAVALTRFDGFVLAFLILGARTLLDRDWKTAGASGAPLVLGLLIYNLWRLSYYPTPLPNTFYAKIAFSPSQILAGINYVTRFVAAEGSYLVLFALAALVVGRIEGRVRMLPWIAAAYLGYVMVAGGDWMPHYRFIVPILPILSLLMQEGICGFHCVARANIRKNRITLAVAVLIVLFPLGLNVAALYRERGLTDLSAPWFQPHEAQRIGRDLDTAILAESVIAIEWGGIVPYYARQEFIDTFGLTDRDIVQQDFPASVTGRNITLEYLAGRRPALVVPCGRVFPSAVEALESTQGSGSCTYRNGHYLSLVGPDHGYELCVVKIDNGAYWPAIVRPDIPERGELCESIVR